MNDNAATRKGVPFNLEKYVGYADLSVVSKTLIKKDTGTITLFAFDAGQGLSEHKAPFDAVVTILDGQAEILIVENLLQIRALDLVNNLQYILNRLSEGGIQSEDIRLRKNTLEDVFIQLTGRRLRE